MAFEVIRASGFLKNDFFPSNPLSPHHLLAPEDYPQVHLLGPPQRDSRRNQRASKGFHALQHIWNNVFFPLQPATQFKVQRMVSTGGLNSLLDLYAATEDPFAIPFDRMLIPLPR